MIEYLIPRLLIGFGVAGALRGTEIFWNSGTKINKNSFKVSFFKNKFLDKNRFWLHFLYGFFMVDFLLSSGALDNLGVI